MNLMSIQTYNNQPTDLEIKEGFVWVTVTDGRVLGVPLEWFPWLENATPEQQKDYKLNAFSIDWEELDEGIDMGTFAGNYFPSGNLVSPETVAEMHDISPNTVYRLLRREADLRESEKRLPGAFKDTGDPYRARWFIPRESAENFVPSSRGRKKETS